MPLIIGLADIEQLAVVQFQLVAGGAALILDIVEQPADLDLIAGSCLFAQTDVFRANREGQVTAIQLGRQLPTQHVGGTDKLGDEGGGRFHV
ncbi:hypothetical protein D3C77_522610 [compost metagenome]